MLASISLELSSVLSELASHHGAFWLFFQRVEHQESMRTHAGKPNFLLEYMAHSPTLLAKRTSLIFCFTISQSPPTLICSKFPTIITRISSSMVWLYFSDCAWESFVRKCLYSLDLGFRNSYPFVWEYLSMMRWRSLGSEGRDQANWRMRVSMISTLRLMYGEYHCLQT